MAGRIEKLGDIGQKLESQVIVRSFRDVVRELVENSVDSGASSIEITVRLDTEHVSVQVYDNGSGITQKGLQVVGKRFHTSKFAGSSLEALKYHKLYGFRGSALNSILKTSSRCTIISRAHTDLLKVEFIGEKLISGPTIFDHIDWRHSGTLIRVVDVFGALPVRKKQLVSSDWKMFASDLRQSVFTALACHPEVEASIYKEVFGDRKLVFSASGSNQVQLLQSVYGTQVLENYDVIEANFQQMTAKMMISNEFTANRTHQYMFLNRRPLRDQQLTKELNQELLRYKDTVKQKSPSKTYPAFIVDITCSKNQVSDLLQEPDKACYRSERATVISAMLVRMVRLNYRSVPRREVSGSPRKRMKRDLLVPRRLEKESPFFSLQSEVRISAQDLTSASVVGQLVEKFILVRAGGAVLVAVDQHACDERIRVEELYRATVEEFLSGYKSLSQVKGLAFSLGEEDLRDLEHFFSSLKDWGIGLATEGSSVRVVRLPSFVRQDPYVVKTGVCEFLKDLRHRRKLSTATLRNSGLTWWQLVPQMPEFYREAIKSRACRNAVMFGDRLTKDECTNLVARLARCRDPFRCAHGRPSVVAIANFGNIGGFK